MTSETETQDHRALRDKATSALAWTSGTLLFVLLGAAVLVFLGSLYLYGARGTALIYDLYQTGLSYCL